MLFNGKKFLNTCGNVIQIHHLNSIIASQSEMKKGRGLRVAPVYSRKMYELSKLGTLYEEDDNTPLTVRDIRAMVNWDAFYLKNGNYDNKPGTNNYTNRIIAIRNIYVGRYRKPVEDAENPSNSIIRIRGDKHGKVDITGCNGNEYGQQ